MAIQIFILSKLMEENNYPYKLKKLLSEPIPFDQLAGLTESKLYYHFDSLFKQGLVEIVEIIKEEHRPDKQVFGITAKGREELPKKIYKLFENEDHISRMTVGLANLKYVDREKIVHILEKKLAKISTKWEQVSQFEKLVQADEDIQPLFHFMSGYITTKADNTIYLLKQLIEQVKQGNI